MKRTLLFVVGLIATGLIAYFGAYYFYISENPKTEVEEQFLLKKSMTEPERFQENNEPGYYLAKIEDNCLMIYKMPEQSLYDYMEVSGLNFQETEKEELMHGISFENLMEVFEFLENTMS